MAELRAVPYGAEGPLPRFRIRGWDTGAVYVDVDCICGHEAYSDPRRLDSTSGAVAFECFKCGRHYRIAVLGAVVELAPAIQPPGER